MVNLQRVKNLEIQRPLELVVTECDAGKASESADVFENIRRMNQKVKQAMKEEMKHRGLSDDDIRHVLHIDND